MNIIKPSFTILAGFPIALDLLERAGRTCYKSEDKCTAESAPAFVEKIARVLKHESVLEHCSVTVKFICDRGVSHELVRHRLASFSQESTRYCDYGKKGMTCILPLWCDPSLLGQHDATTVVNLMRNGLTSQSNLWLQQMCLAELAYNELLSTFSWTPQQARSVLPNSLKTEIVVTANLRQWKHMFSLRCALNAHPQMRELMCPLSEVFAQCCPQIFTAFVL